MHEHFKKVELFINSTQEDYRRKSGVPYWKLNIQEEEDTNSVCLCGQLSYRVNKLESKIKEIRDLDTACALLIGYSSQETQNVCDFPPIKYTSK